MVNFLNATCIILDFRIKKIWILHDVHYVTSLLHPSLKNFDVNPDLKTKAIDLVNEISHRQPLVNINGFINCTLSASDASASGLQIENKNLLSQCFDVPRESSKPTSTTYDELAQYMDLNIQLNEDDDVLTFWSRCQSEFPVLTSIVQKYFAIPATNILVERLFSASKATINDRRTKLNAERITKFLFLQKNLVALKKLENTATHESETLQMKRKTVESSSSTNLFQAEEKEFVRTQKKFKVAEQNNVVFPGEDVTDKENNDINRFLELIST